MLGMPGAAIAAVRDHMHKLAGIDEADRESGRIMDMPYQLVFPGSDPRRRQYPFVRVRIADSALGSLDLCMFVVFEWAGARTPPGVAHVLGFRFWDDDSDWLRKQTVSIRSDMSEFRGTCEEYVISVLQTDYEAFLRWLNKPKKE